MTKELQDLVWSILPKEFKEEVKAMYNGHILNDLDYGRNSALINLFGENLTSDAEGEVMLTVSRNRLMDAFNSAKIIATSKMSSKILAGAADMCIKTFEDVFGSKCLPDEHKECSNPSVVNCRHKHGDGSCSLDGMCYHKSPNPQEPKPAEPKFMVGDYVRYKGGVHKVVATAKDNRCYLNKILGCIDESDLEPYTEPGENIAETHNLSQDCDKLFDSILKDSLSKERRLTIATQMMQGLICAPLVPGVDSNPPAEYLAQTAFRLADALIAEAAKGGEV